MVLQQQIEALIDYLECNREIALGNVFRGKEGREKSRKLWNDLALILNNKGAKPVIKTGDEWRLYYYNEFKYKCLKKIKTQKEEHNATGPPKKIILTPSQDRLYTILRRGGQEPLPVKRDVKVSQDRLYTIRGRDRQELLPVKRDVKVSQDRLYTIRGRDRQEPLPVKRDVKVSQDRLYTIRGRDRQEPLPVERDVKASLDHLYTIRGRDKQELMPVKRDVKASLDHLYTILGRDGQEPLPVERDVKECLDHLYTTPRNKRKPLPGVRIDPLFHEETLPASQCDEDVIEVSTPPLPSPPPPSPPPESTQDRLVRLKQMKADAILAQARATDRLAAAIERGIERLSQPMVIVLQSSKKKRKRRRRSVETSDSESE